MNKKVITNLKKERRFDFVYITKFIANALYLAFHYKIFIIFRDTFFPEPKTLNIAALTSFLYLLLPIFIPINLFYLSIYYFQFPFLEKYKITDMNWPWIEDQTKWKQKFANGLMHFLFNLVIAFPLFIYFVFLNVEMKFTVEDTPGLFTFAWQILFNFMVEEFFFYWVHRILHLPIFYNIIHKEHHSYSDLVYFATVVVHPIELILGDFIPPLAGPAILGKYSHGVVTTVWLSVYIQSSIIQHCGYEFPITPFWMFPGTIPSAYHSYHHLKNSGNYGLLTSFWDTVFRTNEQFYDEMNKIEEESEKVIQT